MTTGHDVRPRGARWLAKHGSPILFGLFLVVVLGGAFFVSCIGFEVPDDKARDVIERAGYTEIRLGGTDRMRCDREPQSRSFTALNPTGSRVHGVICCSVIGCGKGCTMRWDP